jgi:hypothetical protein
MHKRHREDESNNDNKSVKTDNNNSEKIVVLPRDVMSHILVYAAKEGMGTIIPLVCKAWKNMCFEVKQLRRARYERFMNTHNGPHIAMFLDLIEHNRKGLIDSFSLKIHTVKTSHVVHFDVELQESSSITATDMNLDTLLKIRSSSVWDFDVFKLNIETISEVYGLKFFPKDLHGFYDRSYFTVSLGKFLGSLSQMATVLHDGYALSHPMHYIYVGIAIPAPKPTQDLTYFSGTQEEKLPFLAVLMNFTEEDANSAYSGRVKSFGQARGHCNKLAFTVRPHLFRDWCKKETFLDAFYNMFLGYSPGFLPW